MSGASFVFLISSSHPSLLGHFPGRPIVPAVVLLDQVTTHIGAATRCVVTQLQQVKFLQIANPDEAIEVTWELTDLAVTFSGVARRDNNVVQLLSGRLILRPAAGESR